MFHVTISEMLSFPHKLHWGCFSPARCQTAATHLHKDSSPKSRWLPLRKWVACVKCQQRRWSSSAGCQRISKQNVRLLVYLAWCWTSAALFFSISFSSLLLHALTTPPALPCNQSVVPTWKPLAVNWMELLVGCAPIQSLNLVILWMLWLLNSPFVSTQSMLQDQSCFLLWRMGMFQVHCAAAEYLSQRDEQSFLFHCSLYYVLITGKASRT